MPFFSSLCSLLGDVYNKNRCTFVLVGFGFCWVRVCNDHKRRSSTEEKGQPLDQSIACPVLKTYHLPHHYHDLSKNLKEKKNHSTRRVMNQVFHV